MNKVYLSDRFIKHPLRAYESLGVSRCPPVTTLDAPAQIMTQTVRDRQIIGVGSVGKEPGKATYTLYSPYTNAVSFRTVRYGTQGKGFGTV